MRWSSFFRENRWLIALLLYCGISILWSDFPEVALRRWIRALGAVMIVLVVVSEADPIAAVTTLVRRCAYVLIPTSVLLIKYYRELGVEYDYWTGELSLIGVGVNKNGLGRMCLIAALFLFWDLITTWHGKNFRGKRLNLSVSVLLLLLSLWLLVQSKSATSLLSFRGWFVRYLSSRSACLS